MDEEVQFTDEQWEAVATAAEAFAATLDGEISMLGRVLNANWAGACTEGEGTMMNLRDLLRGSSGSFQQAMTGEAEYLKSIAAQCRASKSVLSLVDELGAERFRS